MLLSLFASPMLAHTPWKRKTEAFRSTSRQIAFHGEPILFSFYVSQTLMGGRVWNKSGRLKWDDRKTMVILAIKGSPRRLINHIKSQPFHKTLSKCHKRNASLPDNFAPNCQQSVCFLAWRNVLPNRQNVNALLTSENGLSGPLSFCTCQSIIWLLLVQKIPKQ